MLINKVIPAVAEAALAPRGRCQHAPAGGVKSDRLDFRPTGADCSPQALLRDDLPVRPHSLCCRAKPVRVITTDRIAPQ